MPTDDDEQPWDLAAFLRNTTPEADMARDRLPVRAVMAISRAVSAEIDDRIRDHERRCHAKGADNAE